MKLFLFLLFNIINSISGHFHPAYFRHANDAFMERKRVFSELQDDIKIKELALLGTHNSAAYDHKIPFVTCQALPVKRQLESGIRLFDIRFRQTKSKFALHHGSAYLSQMFGDIIIDVLRFLEENPKELVFLRVKKIPGPEDTGNHTACEILNDYLKGTDKGIIKWFFDDPIRKYRGKILFFFQGDFGPCGENYFNECSFQKHYILSTIWDMYHKWELIKSFHRASNEGSKCYVNYLSGTNPYALVFPAFVASGHKAPFCTGCSRKSTGFLAPLFHYYPDFPRVSCFWGFCTIAFEGMNVLFDEYLKSDRSLLARNAT